MRMTAIEIAANLEVFEFNVNISEKSLYPNGTEFPILSSQFGSE